jgi:predicted DNA binding protein
MSNDTTGRQANLVRLFTSHGCIYIDTIQLSSGRKLLTIYTSRGNRLNDVGATQEIRERASYGVHRDNLYASQELADAASDANWRDLYGDKAMTTKQLREQCAM